MDIIHAHDMNTLLLGWALSRWWRAKLIYDSHELWESVFRERRESISNRRDSDKSLLLQKLQIWNLHLLERLEKWLLPKCDAVISVNEWLCGQLARQVSPQLDACVAVRNICTEFQQFPERRDRCMHREFELPPDTQIVVYVGVITRERGIPQLLDAWELMARHSVALVLTGPIYRQYESEFRNRIEQSGKLRGRVFHKTTVFDEGELIQWLAGANLGIAPIQNVRESYYHCLPNKLFQYIQAELPVVASNFPEMTRLINDTGIGFTIDPAQPKLIASDVTSYLDNIALQRTHRRRLRVLKKKLNRGKEQGVLLDLYERLLPSGTSG